MPSLKKRPSGESTMMVPEIWARILHAVAFRAAPRALIRQWFSKVNEERDRPDTLVQGSSLSLPYFHLSHLHGL